MRVNHPSPTLQGCRGRVQSNSSSQELPFVHSAVPMGGPCGSGEQSLDSNPSSIPYKLCELEASDFASLGFTSFPYKMETKILTMGL